MTPFVTAALQSPWLPVATFLTELLSHASKEIISKDIKANRHLVEPKPLIQLRNHFADLQEATTELAKETHQGILAASYKALRERWLSLFAPAQTMLHNLDPMALATLKIYTPQLAKLLSVQIFVSEQALADALVAERTEITYDTDSHLCTLCLQIVRSWSSAKTIAGGLDELAVVLTETVDGLDGFIRTTWTIKELTS